MPLSQKKLNKGYSLVEILVTLAFLAIIISILLTVGNIWRSIRNLQWQTTAYDISKREMENLRNTQFSNLPSSGAFTDNQLSLLPSGSGQLIVSGTDPKDIKVVVYWNQEGSVKNFTLETLFTAK